MQGLLQDKFSAPGLPLSRTQRSIYTPVRRIHGDSSIVFAANDEPLVKARTGSEDWRRWPHSPIVMYKLSAPAPKRPAGVTIDSEARSKIGSIGPPQMSRRHGDEHLARVFCTMTLLEDQTVGNLQKLLTGTRDLSAVPYTQNQIAGAGRDVILSLPVRH
jgi:hypothetical protein